MIGGASLIDFFKVASPEPLNMRATRALDEKAL